MKTSTILTTLLAGAAACALSTAPAVAAPNLHLAIAKNSATSLKSLGIKTNIQNRTPHNASTAITQTVTFTSTNYSETGHYHTPTLLWAESWYYTSGGKCFEVQKQKQKFPKKTAAAKIKTGTTKSSNPCGTGSFTYYGPDYDLKSTTATSDSFTGHLTAKHVVLGTKTYKLDLIENTDLTIGHP